jgi:hypothetical protein
MTGTGSTLDAFPVPSNPPRYAPVPARRLPPPSPPPVETRTLEAVPSSRPPCPLPRVETSPPEHAAVRRLPPPLPVETRTWEPVSVRRSSPTSTAAVTPTAPGRLADLAGPPHPNRDQIEHEPPSTGVPTRSRAPSPPVDYASLILTTVEQKPFRSARTLFQETGGNKRAVFETVKLMLRDERLVTDVEGVYRVGRRARRELV